jgi:hypothetical protein
MKILVYEPDGSAIAKMTVREVALIERAVTAPVKRKVIEMSPKLQKLAEEILEAKKYNDEFIETFYPSVLPKYKRPSKTGRKRK